MSDPTLDLAEAARIVLVSSEAVSRAARRLVPAADLLERSSASLAYGLVQGRPPDGQDLLTRYGAADEALEATRAAMLGLVDGLEGLRFVLTDLPEPDARLRARALDELRIHLGRKNQG